MITWPWTKQYTHGILSVIFKINSDISTQQLSTHDHHYVGKCQVDSATETCRVSWLCDSNSTELAQVSQKRQRKHRSVSEGWTCDVRVVVRWSSNEQWNVGAATRTFSLGVQKIQSSAWLRDVPPPSQWISTISTSATGWRWVSGPQNPPRPPPPLNDVNPLLQTVHSNILILLQFISCAAVHTMFMLLQVAGVDETFVTQWTRVRPLSRVDSLVNN